MPRHLLFDSTCALCTATAETICNNSTGWIDGVLRLQDPVAEQLLSRAGSPDLWEPALVEVEGDSVRVVTGFALRWRFLRQLGLRNTLRLIRIMSGDFAALSKDADLPADAHRRGVLENFARIGITVGLLSGVGVASRAIAREQKQSSKKWDVLKKWQGLPAERKIRIQGNDLAAEWESFRSSSNVTHLIGMPRFLDPNTALGGQDADMSLVWAELQRAWHAASSVVRLVFISAVPKFGLVRAAMATIRSGINVHPCAHPTEISLN